MKANTHSNIGELPGEVCLACRSSKFSKWMVKTSTNDGRQYPVFKCSECSSAFVVPRPRAEYIEEYYANSDQYKSRTFQSRTEIETYQKVLQDEEDYPNAVLDATSIATRCRALAVGRRFLDIGAGYGFFSRAASQIGFHVTAIEPTKERRGVFRLMCGIEPLSGMLTREFVQANRGSFDVLLMSQVLEHIADLESTLDYLRDLLAPNGIAAIAVPHFGSWLSRIQRKSDMFVIPPEHLNFFSRDGLTILFERHHLTCCEANTVSRINVKRVQRRISIPLLGHAASWSTLAMMKLSDHFGSGMFINAYFRKSPEDAV